MTVTKEPSKLKKVVSLRIDREMWTEFRQKCVGDGIRYGQFFELAIKRYLEGETDE